MLENKFKIGFFLKTNSNDDLKNRHTCEWVSEEGIKKMIGDESERFNAWKGDKRNSTRAEVGAALEDGEERGGG
jgi:hypothetical protein